MIDREITVTAPTWQKGDMMARLETYEAQLPELLSEDPCTWHSLDVDYEPPRVERLWRPMGDAGAEDFAGEPQELFRELYGLE